MKSRSGPKFEEDPEDASLSGLKREMRHDNLRFFQETCSRDLSDHEFYECVFDHVTFTGRCSGVLFCDVILEHCDLSNACFAECVFRRARLSHCRLTGTDLSASTFQDAEISACEGRYLNLNGSRLHMSLLQDCILQQAGFSGCRLQQLEIHGCDFTEAEFIDTRLEGLDFSDSIFSGITASPENLRGITLNAEQALMCAEMMGIHVR